MPRSSLRIYTSFKVLTAWVRVVTFSLFVPRTVYWGKVIIKNITNNILLTTELVVHLVTIGFGYHHRSY